MKRGAKKQVMALVYDKLDTLKCLTPDDREFLRKAYMPSGMIRQSHSSIGEEMGVSLNVVSGRTDRLIAAIIKENAQMELQRQRDEAKRDEAKRKEYLPPVTPQIFTHEEERQMDNLFDHLASDQDRFETLDVVFAAGIMARGYKLIEIVDPPQKNYSKKRIALRVSMLDAEHLANLYTVGKLMVDASTFHHCLKSVKSLLYLKYNDVKAVDNSVRR